MRAFNDRSCCLGVWDLWVAFIGMPGPLNSNFIRGDGHETASNGILFFFHSVAMANGYLVC